MSSFWQLDASGPEISIQNSFQPLSNRLLVSPMLFTTLGDGFIGSSTRSANSLTG
jgi:hypothetical protein